MVHCAGFGGHGLVHAPAVGRAVAELVTRGACATSDLHPLRPTRFAGVTSPAGRGCSELAGAGWRVQRVAWQNLGGTPR